MDTKSDVKSTVSQLVADDMAAAATTAPPTAGALPVVDKKVEPLATAQPVGHLSLGIFPQYVAQKPTTLILQGVWFKKDLNFLTKDGHPFIHVEKKAEEYLLTDANTKALICVIEEERHARGKPYYARATEDVNSKVLLETTTLEILGSDNETTMLFANAMTEGQPTTLSFTDKARIGFGGELMYNGIPVACIKRNKWKVKHEYQLDIVAGMDMFVVAALAVILEDHLPESSGAISGGGVKAGSVSSASGKRGSQQSQASI